MILAVRGRFLCEYVDHDQLDREMRTWGSTSEDRCLPAPEKACVNCVDCLPQMTQFVAAADLESRRFEEYVRGRREKSLAFPVFDERHSFAASIRSTQFDFWALQKRIYDVLGQLPLCVHQAGCLYFETDSACMYLRQPHDHEI